ncbi:MAG: iron ABC transporter permease [Candidatus Symbiothrix sp.]|jgi:iron complex transport system permease protein|nr:iron ABC transporter permease [Candidatus Symbiothrix sp.]
MTVRVLNTRVWMLTLLIVILFLCNLFFGAVRIPATIVWDVLTGQTVERAAWAGIILQSRLPQALTALLSGSALAVSGLMLQTLFQNPLAGPGILGISSGANLGVAVVMLYSGSMLSTVFAAFTGAFIVLALILYASMRVKNNVMVLIIGMMVGYLASSGIAILNSIAPPERIRSYVLWGLGSFSNVSYLQISMVAVLLIVGLTLSLLLIKPLNTLLLGENYASNLGINVRRTRLYILLVTGFLTAVVTAFCGPISFIGLAVPHGARMIFRTSNQQILLPATLALGAVVALFCNLLTNIPLTNGLLPLNAITPLLGAPVILYIIFSQKFARFEKKQ